MIILLPAGGFGSQGHGLERYERKTFKIILTSEKTCYKLVELVKSFFKEVQMKKVFLMFFVASLSIVAVETQACDSVVNSFVQVLVKNGFTEPVLDSVGNVTQVIVHSDYEPFSSFSYIARRGLYSRTYRFKSMFQYTGMPDSAIRAST